MRFKPKTKAEIETDGLLAPGEYDFEIATAEEAISKAGNDMIKLKVYVFDGDGRKHTIFDYLMESVAFKLRHACEACGLEEDYDSGELEAIDFEGRTGRCKVSIQKDKTGNYPDRNGIADYVTTVTVEKVAKNTKKAKLSTRDLDDEIPF